MATQRSYTAATIWSPVLVVLALFCPRQVVAQSAANSVYPAFELGGVLTGVAGEALGGTAGVGGRVTYLFLHDPDDGELQGMLGIEGEVAWLPIAKDPTLFRGGKALEAIFRFKAEIGDVNERLGLKVGSGFVRSDGAIRGIAMPGSGLVSPPMPTRIGELTDPIIELGATYQHFRDNSHWGVRFDVGDTIVIYPNLPGVPDARGRNHFQFSSSLVYRFPMPGKKR